ncbi:helix-turn-helix domain-containing protein [Hyphomicrobium sp.]|uniref:helix-turn-helix domain-containing protein n=1 Tax=Hyphomicrobium sp. TaxID=82 RepID=UPI002D76D06D|nr:helix-turn-helix domain-containing protein [Hyphomicrobium sp.]HET6390179.1 helix-turn-helix domain-containing protein [Hyphomicrobium sp.]
MIGADLKAWRKRNNYTQERLRMELDVSRQTIVTWENSSTPLSRMLELALEALEHPAAQQTGGSRLATELRSLERKRATSLR